MPNPQTTNEVLMIEPVQFGSNPETIADNTFQADPHTLSADRINQRAKGEFNDLRLLLESQGIRVTLFKDDAAQPLPDSIFPNNWFSTDSDSTAVIYPMKAHNRRRERREAIISFLSARYSRVIDLTQYEKRGMFLEGTGSLVLDRISREAYACISERTNSELVSAWATALGYRTFCFEAFDTAGQPIYHTNVMMNIATKFAVVCMECITAPSEREALASMLAESGRVVIETSYAQLHAFCGNILELKGSSAEPCIFMSGTARAAFTDAQLEKLGMCGKICVCDVPTIEHYGGGGVRCMLAELF